jgi:hypothetical protein
MTEKSQKKKQPKKIKNLLDELSPEDLEKINQPSTKGAQPVDQEWMLLTEFLEIAGWQAYLDAKNDARFDPETGKRSKDGVLIVSGAEMLTIIESHRRLEARKLYDYATASFIGAMSAQSKKPGQTFKSLTKDIIKQTKADEA